MTEQAANDYADRLNAKATEFGSPCVYVAKQKCLIWVVQCWHGEDMLWEQA